MLCVISWRINTIRYVLSAMRLGMADQHLVPLHNIASARKQLANRQTHGLLCRSLKVTTSTDRSSVGSFDHQSKERCTVVRTLVCGRRTFPVPRSTCSWRVTTYVGKPSAIGHLTRPTQPFILPRSINWVVSYIACVLPRSGGAIWWLHAYGVKSRWSCGWQVKIVWSR